MRVASIASARSGEEIKSMLSKITVEIKNNYYFIGDSLNQLGTGKDSFLYCKTKLILPLIYAIEVKSNNNTTDVLLFSKLKVRGKAVMTTFFFFFVFIPLVFFYPGNSTSPNSIINWLTLVIIGVLLLFMFITPLLIQSKKMEKALILFIENKR